MTSARRARVVRERLAALRIAGTEFERPAEAVAWLGAVQAQDYLGSLWAVGLRLTRGTELDVERAIADGSIVRTWPMRGTLHLVARADARWLTELLAPRAIAAGAGRLRKEGIDATLLRKARSVLTQRLAKTRYLSRPEIYRLLEAARIETSAQRGLIILWRLAHECFLCFGPRVGKQPSFALFDDWVPDAPRITGEEALATLAVRYFRAHGPATARDLAWWSGLPLGEARRATLAAGCELAHETFDGEAYFVPSAVTAPVRSRASVHVLPAFDELLVGYAQRGTFVEATVTERVRSGGMIRPVVVVDGRVRATWSRRLTAREVVCEVQAFEPLRASERKGILRAFERYARFVGRTLRLSSVR